jgi:hypothetical protein
VLAVILSQRNGTNCRLLHLDICFAYGIRVFYHKATTKIAATIQTIRVRIVYIYFNFYFYFYLYASTTRVFEYRYSNTSTRASILSTVLEDPPSSTRSGTRATLSRDNKGILLRFLSP